MRMVCQVDFFFGLVGVKQTRNEMNIHLMYVLLGGSQNLDLASRARSVVTGGELRIHGFSKDQKAFPIHGFGHNPWKSGIPNRTGPESWHARQRPT